MEGHSPEKEFLSTREVAAWLGIPERSVREYARRGLLPYFQLGRHKLFKKEAVLAELGRSRHGNAWYLLR